MVCWSSLDLNKIMKSNWELNGMIIVFIVVVQLFVQDSDIYTGAWIGQQLYKPVTYNVSEVWHK